MLDSLLFKIITTPEKETTLLAIPEICTYNRPYHPRSSRCDKTYLTIGDKFFIQGVIHYLWSYIKGCHISQLSCNEKLPTRQLQMKNNLNYRPLSRLSMDLTVMLRTNKDHRYILCIIDEVIKYLIMVLIHQSRSEEIGDALIENVITKYCMPNYIIMDQDSAFMSSIMNYLFKKLDIKIKTLTPYNHQSLQA